MDYNKIENKNYEVRQHIHDVEGYVEYAGKGRLRHTHCFETESGRAIPYGNSHVHKVEFITDEVDCHCHKFCGTTGPAIPTGFGNHIHILRGKTTYDANHRHCVFVATGIEEPIRC